MSREKALEAILVISMAFLVVFFFKDTEWGQWNADQRQQWIIENWPMATAFVLGLIGIFIKSLAMLISTAWMKLAQGIGFVMSKVILSVVFFLFLFPIAMLFRLFNKDSLKLKARGRSSTYIERNHQFEAKDLENAW